MPASYRGCGSSEVLTDDAGTAPPGFRSFQEIEHNGLLYGCSRVRLRDVLDGTSTTLLVGESYTDVNFVQDGNAMDYWYLGSPQIDPCRCDGSMAGTEFSEFVGATAARLNARRIPTTSGYEKEMAFGSYHAGGAYFGFADGSVRFVSDAVDQALYRPSAAATAPRSSAASERCPKGSGVFFGETRRMPIESFAEKDCRPLGGPRRRDSRGASVYHNRQYSLRRNPAWSARQ